MGIIIRIEGRIENDDRFVSFEDNLAQIQVKIGQQVHFFKENAKLFLNEFGNFISELQIKDKAVWRVEFEPYRFGRQSDIGFEVSKDSKFKEIETVINEIELEELKSDLGMAIEKYGVY